MSITQFFNNLFDYRFVYFLALHIRANLIIGIPVRVWGALRLKLFFGFFEDIHKFIAVQDQEIIEWIITVLFWHAALFIEELGVGIEQFLNVRRHFSDRLEWIIDYFESFSGPVALLGIFFLVVGTFFVAVLVIRGSLVQIFVSHKYFFSFHLKNT